MKHSEKSDKSQTIAAILVLAADVTLATRLPRWWQLFESDDCERWIKISSQEEVKKECEAVSSFLMSFVFILFTDLQPP